MKIAEAIVLAGGLGTRLRATLPDTPKCMAVVAGKPFLHYVIQYLLAQGIEKIIFSLGYRHTVVETYLATVWQHIAYETVVETSLLGTGGATRLASKKLSTPQAVVVNGDTLFLANLSEVCDMHLQQRAACTLLLKPMKHIERYGVVETQTDGRVLRFQEKKYYAEGTINGGIYLLDSGVFSEKIKEGVSSFEKDFLEAYCQSLLFFGYIQDRYFIDIGIAEDYLRANKELATHGTLSF